MATQLVGGWLRDRPSQPGAGVTRTGVIEQPGQWLLPIGDGIADWRTFSTLAPDRPVDLGDLLYQVQLDGRYLSRW
ncbi:hypothetical protein E0H26_13915 [Micromonospora zingiberis]|uniref:Uncharacterized protein n=1 Tax=Micromonospora zingiberis TaxID=2053011 RepID=A0A4R0GK47_9ACTN|nr:hypothetical protein [Micromonospora zingiberis]TCB96723.1 hypothetical protein E0H26_13915 [Micromonospora zingiberis]